MGLLCLLALVLAVAGTVYPIRYEPNWESLDSRPLPSWFDESKLGIMLHWGVFSVPSLKDEWFWYWWKSDQTNPEVVNFMKQNFRPGFTYADFAPMFQAEFFNPDQWADIIQASGAKYMVLTTKHHEGFTMWPSKVSWTWNAQNLGPKRDLVGDLANAIRKNTDVHFGIYHSLFEWFNPLYLQDKANGYTTQDFVARKAMPELYELVNTYKPDLIWSDGDWMVNDTYWNSTHFLAWLYNESPVKDVIIVNDRWGNDTWCRHGGYFNCRDKFNPDVLQDHKWEDVMSIDTSSFGFRRNAEIKDLYTVDMLIALLVKTVSLGGNLLVNVGPTAYGEIAPAYEERLRGMGQWLKVNGEAIYSTHPWIHQTDPDQSDVRYTSRNYTGLGEVVYAISSKWYGGSTLHLGGATPGSNTTIHLVGTSQRLHFVPSKEGGLDIEVPHFPLDQISTPGHAWAFRLDFLENRRK